jgi:hypothetical protein
LPAVSLYRYTPGDLGISFSFSSRVTISFRSWWSIHFSLVELKYENLSVRRGGLPPPIVEQKVGARAKPTLLTMG